MSEEWIPFTNNMPRVSITDLEINNQNTAIFASTFGRGVWESELPYICTIFLVIEGTLEGDRFYEAANIITSTNEIIGGAGTVINFHAGDRIVLKQGFSTTNFSKFYGKIENCGVGID